MLVSLTRAGRIGYLDDPYIFPCVGNDADGPNPYGELAFPLEGCWFNCFLGVSFLMFVFVWVDVVGSIEGVLFFLPYCFCSLWFEE